MRAAHVTCLGCGCACDDIVVHTADGRILDTTNTCEIGAAWFGDGTIPDRIHVGGQPVSAERAIHEAATLLLAAKRPLVFAAPELSCEAQRVAIGIADALRATLDTMTTATALPSVIASQERGRASATLGEIRNRADLLVFWGVDPAARYPRYWTRYAPEPAGLHVAGRGARRVVAVDIGEDRGPADADVRIRIDGSNEVATLTALDALACRADLFPEESPWREARQLLDLAKAARYAVFVADAEPPAGPRDGGRAAALITATQGLNVVTRAALSSLRGGGNRVGMDAVLTAQTGYPARVDFSLGYPVYTPHGGAAADAMLIAGDATRLPEAVLARMTGIPVAVIGPRASHLPAREDMVAIDTGVAGIHEPGTALRLDDVPLPLRPTLPTPHDTVTMLQRVLASVRDGAPSHGERRR